MNAQQGQDDLPWGKPQSGSVKKPIGRAQVCQGLPSIATSQVTFGICGGRQDPELEFHPFLGDSQ